MPVYEYQCKSCDHVWELWLSPDPPKTRKCVKCGKRAKKIISVCNHEVKGANAKTGYS